MRRGAAALIVLLAGCTVLLAGQTGSNAPLPQDVNPESRNRLPPLKPGVQAVVVGYPNRNKPEEMRAERITVGGKTVELR